jgi:hypothetical protein
VDFISFSYKGANFRISCDTPESVQEEIRHQRSLLEEYIQKQSEFAETLKPIALLPDAPPIAVLMGRAALKCNVGPMAAVAGCIAQFAAEAAIRADARHVIVDNGGDIYLKSRNQVIIGIHTGDTLLSSKLAFKIDPALMPLAVCSSSSRMGHSKSFGDCDLVTVTAGDAALADAAATRICNEVHSANDIEAALQTAAGISGIDGVLIATDGKVGISGELPPLVRGGDPNLLRKITRDKNSGL